MDLGIIFILNWIGTLTFAATGALAGVKKKFDIIGITVLAFVTAVGGGSIRDIVVGILPPGALKDNILLSAILILSIMIYFFHRYVFRLDKGIYFLDTLGLGLFAVLGAERGINAGLGIWGCVFTGSVSGIGGGILRDVLSGDIPIVFYRAGDFYATAAVSGSVIVYLLYQFSETAALICGLFAVLIIRIGSHYMNLKWPIAATNEHQV